MLVAGHSGQFRSGSKEGMLCIVSLVDSVLSKCLLIALQGLAASSPSCGELLVFVAYKDELSGSV